LPLTDCSDSLGGQSKPGNFQTNRQHIDTEIST
jgi:hypothetical protein